MFPSACVGKQKAQRRSDPMNIHVQRQRRVAAVISTSTSFFEFQPRSPPQKRRSWFPPKASPPVRVAFSRSKPGKPRAGNTPIQNDKDGKNTETLRKL